MGEGVRPPLPPSGPRPTETLPGPLPVPVHGEIFLDPRDDGRALRVSWHEDAHTAVLSLWRGEVCIGTHRLAPGDVGRLVQLLLEGQLAVPGRPARDRRSGRAPC
jgi:hypothetical protein